MAYNWAIALFTISVALLLTTPQALDHTERVFLYAAGTCLACLSLITSVGLIYYSILSHPGAQLAKLQKYIFRECLLVRQSFFQNNPKNFANIGGGVIGCGGFPCNLRTSQGGLSLSIDVSTTMTVCPRPVVGFLLANQNVKDAYQLDWNKLILNEYREELYKECVTAMQGGLLLTSNNFGVVREAIEKAFANLDVRLSIWIANIDPQRTFNINQMTRSSGFSLGGTFQSSLQQQQLHNTTAHSGELPFATGNTQDLRSHGSDFFPSHDNYHSQIQNSGDLSIGLRPLNSPTPASGMSMYEQLIQKYQQPQSLSQLQLQQMSDVS
ncbi:hypothetical protein ZIOFF_069986 [Zingiber officinale]|uniref:Argonaute linker 1 domain-containing protein n=1 Tax=Zingiber officinale TaxID=94328 RepID=A0A8J5EUC5_ZINOF|nr:hypothetical protein ZIOFF_069986 [Zingiber officinale]